MDRLLLLMPRFMDYEKSLKENLNRKYEVCWLTVMNLTGKY